MPEKERLFLIVDDDPDMCWALEVILRKRGLPAQKAQSGAEALRLMESIPFRLALVDAKLPDMDGLELVRRMRRFDPALPIVMVSGYFYANDRAIKEAMAAGWIFGFISKPFEHEEIAKFL